MKPPRCSIFPYLVIINSISIVPMLANDPGRCDFSVDKSSSSYCRDWATFVTFIFRNGTTDGDLRELRHFLKEIVKNCGDTSELAISSNSELNSTVCRLSSGNCDHLIDAVSPSDGISDNLTLNDLLLGVTTNLHSSPGWTANLFLLITNIPCEELNSQRFDVDNAEEDWLGSFWKEKIIYHHVAIISGNLSECEQSDYALKWSNYSILKMVPEGGLLNAHFIEEMTVCKSASKLTLVILLCTLLPCVCAVCAVVGIYIIMRRRAAALAGVAARRYSDDYSVRYQAMPNSNRFPSWELDGRDLTVDWDVELGRGAFAIVYKGTLKAAFRGHSLQRPSLSLQLSNGPAVCYEVAVKVLREEASDASRADFYGEMAFLKRLGEHPHVLTLLGSVSHFTAPKIVTEYCGRGDLLKFLRQQRNIEQSAYSNFALVLEASPNGLPEMPNSFSTAPTVIEDDNDEAAEMRKLAMLNSFSWQIADGMTYLSAKHLIHRDLATRNVLLTDSLVAKISDFGLCRCAESDIYQARGGLLPFRWMAPESLTRYEFSDKTDVWSYGMVLFEIFTFGETPFAGIEPTSLARHLEEGNRPAQPDRCPDKVYQIMSECWAATPEMRPDFAQLRHFFEEIMRVYDQRHGYLNIAYDDDELPTEDGFI